MTDGSDPKAAGGVAAAPRSAPTMREVADLANVSPATVSRVLNGSELVNDDLRARVLDVVARVDYRPNRLARNLRLQRAETLGVLVPDVENPHFNEAVRIFEDTAFRSGYRVVLCNTDETVEKQRAYAQVLADERARGAIVAPVDRDGRGLEPLLELGIPTVGFDRVVADPRADTVVCDNAAATRIATEHLIGLGHERIAFVAGPRDADTGVERREGYESAMRAAGLAPASVEGDFRTAGAERAVAHLLAEPERPRALLVANNLMAIGALRAIRGAGLRVPDDVALVAIDDPSWAELVDPPLTVVAQDVRRMAQAAISLLLDRIEGRRSDPTRVVLPVALRVRASCGAQTRRPTTKEL